MPDQPQRPVITTELLRELGDWRAEKLGRELAATGAVLDWHWEPPYLSGTVRGAGGAVKSRIKLGPRGFDCANLCACKQARVQGTICAHVMALVFATMQPAAASTPQTQPASPPPAGPVLQCVPLEEATEANPVLELMVLLPLDLPKAARGDSMRIILEGRLNGGNFVPLDTIPQSTIYAVGEADQRVLQAGQSAGLWLLSAADYDRFFTALAAHPAVWLGKRTRITVQTQGQQPTLRLELLAAGQARLQLSQPQHSGERLGHWLFDGHTLQRSVALPPGYPPGEHQLGRAEFARFCQQELPALQSLLRVEFVGPFDQLDFAELPGPVAINLDGALAGLNLQFSSTTPSRDWTPDPDKPFRYWRHRPTSDTEVLAAGFEPRPQGGYRLAGEQRVGHFLANTLPAWERRWSVQYGPQFAQFLRQCDRIEPAVNIRPAANNWLAVDLAYKNAAGALSLSPAEVQRLLQTGASHQRLPTGRLALVPTAAIQQFQDVLFDCDARQAQGRLQVNRQFVPYLAEALQEEGLAAHWELPAALRQAPPLVLPGFLRGYQRAGVEWLHQLAANGLAGILADEMGLGKTIQTLVWLQSLAAAPTSPKRPSLIVCPTSLLANWQAELERFTPELKPLLLHGSDRHGRFDAIAAHDVVITSYALLRRDLAQHQTIHWQSVVLDEAQQIKNRFSQNAQAVKSLSATHRLVLTGTPLENSLGDLWSIFDFLMPGYLGPAAEFRDRYEIPITKLQDQAALGRLRQRLRPFLLRRAKAEVARELPPRLDQVTWCELTAEQQSVYQAILTQGRRALSAATKESAQRIAVLTTLLRLRQACCHLGLLPAEQNWLDPSAKLDTCLELIEEAVSGGHRVLVFSQFVKLLRLLQAALPVPHCYLDGSTLDRAGEIARFQGSSIPVFLISLKAGGTGLNLTGADTVIHLDPWWNPAVEEQATARAHRIGQQQVVTSYKLIARGTVEEKIVRLQQSKRTLVGQLVTSDEMFVQGLSLEELRQLVD